MFRIDWVYGTIVVFRETPAPGAPSPPLPNGKEPAVVEGKHMYAQGREEEAYLKLFARYISY